MLLHTYYAVPRPCRVAKGLECVVPIWFTYCERVGFTHAMPCLCRVPAVLRPCFFWKRLLEATAQHSSGTELHVLINICGLSAACGPPAQIRLLPAITRTLTTVVNQNATAFWDVFNLFWWWWRHQVIQNYTFLRTKLKVKDSLPFVVIIRLHRVFFFWLSVDNNYFKISKFEVIILKY